MLREWGKLFGIKSLFVFWEAIKLLTMGALVLSPLIPDLSDDHVRHLMQKYSCLNLTWQRISYSPTPSTQLNGAVLGSQPTLLHLQYKI